jgi:hypothetical protein
MAALLGLGIRTNSPTPNGVGVLVRIFVIKIRSQIFYQLRPLFPL